MAQYFCEYCNDVVFLNEDILIRILKEDFAFAHSSCIDKAIHHFKKKGVPWGRLFAMELGRDRDTLKI
jgi:hypothetical protein